MAQLTIRPTRIEHGLHREQYADLLQALREAGYNVRLDDPDDREETRALPGEVVQAAHDVAVFVDAHWHEAETLAALALLVRKKLRSRSKRRRTAVFYGPNGEVLKRVTLNDGD